ncbi:hypothetical protein M6B38_253555 [Iris pallida]|uniref:Uncharacterized protein n=1 Tax=Iris pallida TaxID=29817 RepID=A0AAX6IHM1_IRIPA|nr:hypothetical protein M6B38_253555 [Iris pallida]
MLSSLVTLPLYSLPGFLLPPSSSFLHLNPNSRKANPNPNLSPSMQNWTRPVVLPTVRSSDDGAPPSLPGDQTLYRLRLGIDLWGFYCGSSSSRRTEGSIG